jgi:hypothetical protein
LTAENDMAYTQDEFKERTKQFALRVIRLVNSLPTTLAADESIFWMELLVDSKMIKAQLVTDLMREANEILAMVVASIRTARRKERR